MNFGCMQSDFRDEMTGNYQHQLTDLWPAPVPGHWPGIISYLATKRSLPPPPEFDRSCFKAVIWSDHHLIGLSILKELLHACLEFELGG